MIRYLLLAVSTVLARSTETEYKCIEGKSYKIQMTDDSFIANDTGTCCDGYFAVDDVCIESLRPAAMDPMVVSRFVTAIIVLLIFCLAIAVISMLIAYKMFYKRVNKGDMIERVTLAEDIEVESCSSMR